MPQTPCCAVQQSPVAELVAGTHLNFHVPAVDDLYDAHHVIEHQTQLLTVICKAKTEQVTERVWRFSLLQADGHAEAVVRAQTAYQG